MIIKVNFKELIKKDSAGKMCKVSPKTLEKCVKTEEKSQKNV